VRDEGGLFFVCHGKIKHESDAVSIILRTFVAKFSTMEKVLADNVKRICKEHGIQLKDLAGKMGIDPASLTRALNGNARFDTIERIASALGVSMKSLFEPLDDVEGYIRIGERVYQFNSKQELLNLIDL
jgi:DNA-binding Xre family transcriptional regulator